MPESTRTKNAWLTKMTSKTFSPFIIISTTPGTALFDKVEVPNNDQVECATLALGNAEQESASDQIIDFPETEQLLTENRADNNKAVTIGKILLRLV